MKILVSGAAGFLGRKFSEYYDNFAEHEIIAVDDMSNPRAKAPILFGGEFWEDSIESAIRYFKAKGRKFDLMLHFAAPVGGREKIENDPLFNAGSLAIDSTVFRWAIDNVDRMVYPSSSAVYPIYMQTEYIKLPLREQDMEIGRTASWARPDEMYGFTKMAGEVLAYYAARYGLDTLVLRPFSGYGEGQSHDYPFPSLMSRVARRDDPVVIWGDGTAVRDFIHVDDILGWVGSRVEAGWSGYVPANLGSGIGTSFNELVEMAVVIEGYTPDIQHLLDKPVGVHYRVSASSIPITVSLEEGVNRMLDYERKLL